MKRKSDSLNPLTFLRQGNSLRRLSFFYASRKVDRVRKKENKVDRLSDLPDEILWKIFSFLPMQSVLATSTLSKRWTNVWMGVENLELCGVLSYLTRDQTAEDHSSFTRFLDKVSSLDRPSLRLLKLSVTQNLGGALTTDFGSWMAKMMMRGVTVFQAHWNNNLSITLPPGFFSSENLVELNLDQRFVVKFPPDMRCPNLKACKLSGVELDASSVTNLLSQCPTLEVLHLEGFSGSGQLYLSSSTLKTVTILPRGAKAQYMFLATPNLELLSVSDSRKIQFLGIVAPALRYLTVENVGHIKQFAIPDVPAIEGAVIRNVSGQEAMTFLHAVRDARSLDVDHLTSGFLQAPDVNLKSRLPVFDNLTRLHVGIGANYSLECLLQRTVRLKSLAISFVPMRDYSEWIFVWTNPRPMPICLDSIEEIRMENFPYQTGKSYMVTADSVMEIVTRDTVMKMINYFLRNCKVLKRMYLKGYYDAASSETSKLRCREEIEEAMGKIPRASSACEVYMW